MSATHGFEVDLPGKADPGAVCQGTPGATLGPLERVRQQRRRGLIPNTTKPRRAVLALGVRFVLGAVGAILLLLLAVGLVVVAAMSMGGGEEMLLALVLSAVLAVAGVALIDPIGESEQEANVSASFFLGFSALTRRLERLSIAPPGARITPGRPLRVMRGRRRPLAWYQGGRSGGGRTPSRAWLRYSARRIRRT